MPAYLPAYMPHVCGMYAACMKRNLNKGNPFSFFPSLSSSFFHPPLSAALLALAVQRPYSSDACMQRLCGKSCIVHGYATLAAWQCSCGAVKQHSCSSFAVCSRVAAVLRQQRGCYAALMQQLCGQQLCAM